MLRRRCGRSYITPSLFRVQQPVSENLWKARKRWNPHASQRGYLPLFLLYKITALQHRVVIIIIICCNYCTIVTLFGCIPSYHCKVPDGRFTFGRISLKLQCVREIDRNAFWTRDASGYNPYFGILHVITNTIIRVHVSNFRAKLIFVNTRELY